MALTRAQLYNRTHAPSASDLPPSGRQAYPGLYEDSASSTYEAAARRFQADRGLPADGRFGPRSLAAFLAAFPDASPAPPRCAPPTTGLDLQVWVGWGVIDEAELAWVRRLGVTTLIFNLNKAEAPGTWQWEDGQQGARVAREMALARSHGFRTIGMVWAWRHATFHRQAVTAVAAMHARVPLDGIQFDVEGSWVNSGKGGGLSDEAKVDRWWRPAWAPFFAQNPGVQCSCTPLYFLRPSVDALLDEPEVSAIYPQAYSPWLPGDSAKARATHATSFRAPALQHKAMANYSPRFRANEEGAPVEIVGGVGGFLLRTPHQTPTESMRAQARAFVEAGADGLCLWALHTIQVGRGRAWPDEAEHRAAWERVCLEYGEGMGESPQQPHAPGVAHEEIAPGVILRHDLSWWQRLSDPYRPPVPASHARVGGQPLGRKVYDAATAIRKMGQAEGTYLPFIVDGVWWCAVTCRHTHTHTKQGQVVEVPGGTRAVTVFKAKPQP